MAPMLRVDTPTALDLAFLAQRMRGDEFRQFTGLTGIDRDVGDAAGRAAIGCRGPVWCIYDGPAPIMAGGFDPIRPGVFEVWGIGTPAGWHDHGAMISRTAARFCRRMLDTGRAHRLQIQALADRPQAHEWYRRALRMQHEATLSRAAADGGDLLIFARVRP